MQRSPGVTVVGVFSLLGSMLTLLLGALMLLAAAVAPHSSTPTPGFAAMAFSSLFLFAPAVWGITTSIGVFRLKRWARTSILLFAALLTLMGLSLPLVFLAMPAPPVPSQAVSAWTAIRSAMTVFYLCLAALGVWWLVLFTRPSVKEQFQGGVVNQSERPTSITIIAWLLLVSSPFTLACALFRVPALFFNSLLTGWSATACYLAFGIVTFFLGMGLLRLDPRARVFAIYYSVFAWVNAVFAYTLPGTQQRLQELAKRLPSFLKSPSTQPAPAINPWFMVAWISLFMLVQIYFLVTRKPAFDRSAHRNGSSMPPVVNPA